MVWVLLCAYRDTLGWTNIEQKEKEGAMPWVHESTDDAEAVKPRMNCGLVIDTRPLEFDYATITLSARRRIGRTQFWQIQHAI